MRVSQTFEPEFDELYNKYHESPKGRLLLEQEGIGRKALDIGEMSRAYFTEKISDMSIDPNASADEEHSVNNYTSETTKGILKIHGYYLIWKYTRDRYGVERANECLRAIWDGDVYFHDASGPMVQIPYCFAFSTSMLMQLGRPYGQLHSLPPKRADSFIHQATEMTMDVCQEFAGAVAPGDLLVNYAWYAKKEGLSDKRIINDLQSFVHTMNNKFRVSGQSPFSNLSIFDKPNLETVFGEYVYPDLTHVDIDYVMHIQKLFGEWFAKGDPVSGFPYRFPIVTINISCDENKEILDKDFMEWVAKINTERGCFNIYINSGNKIASCCRLISDGSRMDFKSDTFGNGGLNIGSHRVITVNPVRAAIRARGDVEKFYDELEKMLEIAQDLLVVHREEILERRIRGGFSKFFNPLNWFKLDHMFSTIGIIGIYEANHMMGLDIRSPEGTEFTEKVLRYIEDFATVASMETKHSFNVEEIPGESVAVKFCLKDKIVFGDNVTPFELYSNQYIPLILDAPMPERIQLTGKFMDILSGGGILHLNIADKITDWRTMQKLIQYSVKSGVSHLAVSYGFGRCTLNHTTICGNSTTCKICGEPIVDHMLRIVGYFAKVTNWNKTRREFEFERRKFGKF